MGDRFELQLEGKASGWTRTGIKVTAGEELQVTASGLIRFFSIGYVRDPDGKDQQGKTEIASAGWPAPGLVRNSLVFRVGSRPIQGGTNTTLLCPAAGELEMSNNDDVTGDNAGAWSISVARMQRDE